VASVAGVFKVRRPFCFPLDDCSTVVAVSLESGFDFVAVFTVLRFFGTICSSLLLDE